MKNQFKNHENQCKSRIEKTTSKNHEKIRSRTLHGSILEGLGRLLGAIGALLGAMIAFLGRFLGVSLVSWLLRA